MAFWGIGRFCKGKTEGFAVAKILRNSEREERPVSPPPEEVRHIFQNPLTYLGRGVQSYVFASSDGKYVVKWIRHDRWKCHPWSRFLPKSISQNHVEKRKNRSIKDFTSYQIAQKELEKETGILYLHLGSSSFFHQKAVIIDKLGIRHTLNLDTMDFIVQKRAKLVFQALDDWVREDRLEKAKEGLSSLVQILRTRMEKGIYDKDPDLNTNFGFIDSQAIQIDVGRFRKHTPCDKAEIVRITDNLHQWLMVHSPELDLYLRKILDEI